MIKATHFDTKIQNLKKEIISETLTIMACADTTRVECTAADDESVDWCDKLTIEYEDDFTGNVQNVVVESISNVGGRLLIIAKEPDFLDEIKIWQDELSIDSLSSIHTEVCNRLGAIQYVK